MGVSQVVPDGLAGMAPGPELGRVLAAIDMSRVSGFDCVEVLQAQYRQLNHETARLLGAMVEVGRCTGLDELSRSVEPHEFAADEIRAALMWSRRAAEGRFAFGLRLGHQAALGVCGAAGRDAR